MAAYRLYDIFNAFIGATQVLGARTLEATQGYRTVKSNTDGTTGQAAVDKTFMHAGARLGCEDVANFGTLVGLFEATDDSLAVRGEGKIAGDAAKSGKLTVQRCKLVRASLRIGTEQYGQTDFEFRNSAAAASNSPDDELALVEIASKTITTVARYRCKLLKTGATFTPNGGGAINLAGMHGLELDVVGQADAAVGDDTYGEVVEVAGWEVSGALLMRDLTIASLQTPAQQLMAAGWGTLALPYTQEQGQADKTMTLANLLFHDDATGLAARKMHTGRVPFSCFFNSGATQYKFGTGASKIYTVA